ncbi:MAG: GNAT family N-acetyltransferase [Crocinitomicaceae bacterium]|nr:GNAT family N-acetyltransferase [Crocinitomicaceae bacterium]
MLSLFSANQFRLTDEQFERLYQIITHAYEETEKVMWGEGYVRMERKEFLKCIDRDEVIIALLGGKIVGGIRYYHLKDNTWSFSLLAADFNEKGKGIGRKLVEEVEQIIKSKGGDFIHIEVLRPIKEKVEAKEVISQWYKRMGYELVKEISLEDLYPEKIDLLKTPSVFDCYLKKL